ncbi:MAG: DNA adenine methylase [Janthinobacterium lividum]
MSALTKEIPRPALRYHGGKWKLAPWIVSHFAPHSTYTEVYGGGGSVLLRKPRAVGEVYNDLDGDVVNLFRVLRDPLLAARLREQLHYTKYDRREFEGAQLVPDEPVEAARCLIVRSFMSYGSAGSNPAHRTGFRATSTRGAGKTGPATEWATYPDLIPALTARLAGVVIEERPAVELLAKEDKPSCLHYVDPPYPLGTRTAEVATNGCYRFEMSDDDHRKLASVLHRLVGQVVLSGYACDLYDQELFPTWERFTNDTHADGGRPRTEVLWLNPAASASRRKQHDLTGLFR